MKKLIINADDFGLSRGINRGIAELFGQGAITSASLLVNMPGFEDAVDWIKNNPHYCIGLHINVMRGRPLSKAALESDLCLGPYFSGRILPVARAVYAGKKALEAFAAECRAQIDKAVSHGVAITHLDSEKHVHMIPPLFKALAAVARQYGISKIRCVNEGWLSFRTRQNKNILKLHGLESPDFFRGLRLTGRMTLQNCLQTLAALSPGTTELMCHPGYMDEEWQQSPLSRERYFINGHRSREIGILSDPRTKSLIKEQGIVLASYREM